MKAQPMSPLFVRILSISALLFGGCPLLLGACGESIEAGPDHAGAGATNTDAASTDVTSADTSAVANGCEPGFAGCVEGKRVVCNEAGTSFAISPCEKDTFCFAGKCSACAADDHCDAGQTCQAGTCLTPPLTIVTESLPTALVGQAYSVKLVVDGGKAPYTWQLDQGALPDGILVSSDGEVKGVPTKEGKASISIEVTDANKAVKSRIYVLEVKAGGLVITSSSPLAKGQEGKPYNVQLKAQGGDKPYFWGLKSGKLPAGVSLGADGKLTGTPTVDGTFNFEIKALDDGSPTLSTTKGLEITVSLAPLEIVGAQQINLLITKIIVLPLIIVVKGVPVPYSNKLQATGGKKPYKWTEEPLPGAVKSFLPKSGIPKGLTLNTDGTLAGSVTDPMLAAEVKIPLSQITLKGFFFAAKVTDSQEKAKSKTALFIIPTAPVNL
jgi:hypothetical protein